MTERGNWQVQEAKQRFSEVLRAVEAEGPQTITRHGEQIAVIVDVQEFRRLTCANDDFVKHITAFPKASAEPDVFDEIEAERAHDLPRSTEFEADLGLRR